jgi:hypothetical protein
MPGTCCSPATSSGHNIGGNYESQQTRRALYYRISSADHASHRSEFL